MGAVSTSQPNSPLPTPAEILGEFDTTKRSLLHWVLRFGGSSGRGLAPGLWCAYSAAVAATYLPLLITASIELPSLIQTYGTVKLPFLRDWNLLFMLTIVLPALVAYIASDDRAVTSAVSRVIRDDVIELSADDAVSLRAEWEKHFAVVNTWAQVIGVIIGGVLVVANEAVYSRPEVGYWIVVRGRVGWTGVGFLSCVFFFYGLTALYVLRSTAAAWFLRDLVNRSRVKILPFHPDRCGGLRPVGTLGLRNQYLLSLYGINLVLLVSISLKFLSVPSSLYWLMFAGAVAYIICGPIVFLGPLIPFRGGMMRAKTEVMSEIAGRLRCEIDHVRSKLKTESVSKDEEESIDRLRRIGSIVDDFPVWPFDARTARRFMTAYVVPLAGSLGYSLGTKAFDMVYRHFQP